MTLRRFTHRCMLLLLPTTGASLWPVPATAQIGPRIPNRSVRPQPTLNTLSTLPAGPAPTGFTATAAGPITVQLSWQAAAGAAGYQVFRTYAGGRAEPAFGATPITATSFTDRGARPNSTITYFVQAMYPQNGPGQSAPVTVTTPRGLQATNFTASPAGNNAVNLTWTAAQEATGYVIHRSDGPFLNNGQPMGGTSAADRNVPSGRYTYTLVAYYNGVEGDLSAGAPSADVTVFPLTADYEQDFGGGKHGKAHAVLDASGALNVTIDTWTNSPLQGFTMAALVAGKDGNGAELVSAAAGPFGVDGTATPMGSASQRHDVHTEQFDPANADRVSQLFVIVYPDPKWRIVQDLNRVHETVRDICRQYGPDNTYLSTGCKFMGF
jgi:hypothetical protein